jgi:hypothetical protein
MQIWTSKVLWGWVAVVVLVSQISVVAAANNEKEKAFCVPPGERQLFLDDVGILKVDHLKRTLHQPAKKGAVIRPDLPWETTLQTRSAPVWDPSVKQFKLWMTASTNIPGVAGATYAQSRDGLHWTKPSLRQKEINGSLENNFVTVDPKREWPANAISNVVFDPDDPDPSRRFKGLLHCFVREPIVSPDGIHWKLLDVPEIPSQDESNMSYDRQTRMFIATVKHGGPYGRSVHLTTSKDFEHWTKPVLIFHADELDQELGREHIKARQADHKLQMQRPLWDIRDTYKGRTAEPKVDVYNMGLFRYEGLYIGTPAMFHSNDNRWNKDGFHLIQLVCSRDLKTFKRLGNRQTFIGPSPVGQGAYDLTQLIGPSAPVIREDELWFYYTGIKYRTPPKDAEHDAKDDNGAICLAVLRRDGFISLDAGANNGMILTEPFTVAAGKLLVNVDAPTGELSVEVLDARGKVVAQSEPLTGDLLREQVKWAKGDMADLEGQTASLRFTLRNGQFYSYWLE